MTATLARNEQAVKLGVTLGDNGGVLREGAGQSILGQECLQIGRLEDDLVDGERPGMDLLEWGKDGRHKR